MIDMTTKLPTAPAEPTTPEYLAVFNLNAKIHYCKDSVERGLADMCIGIEQMRSEKQYKQLGYQNFEDYCLNEFGFSDRQGRKYADVGKMLNNENRKLTSGFENLGMEKLHLLSKLDEPTLEVVAETVDVESVTVRELKAQISALQTDKDKLETETADLGQQLDAAKESLASKDKQFKEAMESKNRQLQSTHKQWVDSQNEVAKLTSKNYDLEEQLKNLESRPVEVAVSEEEAKEIERLKKELEDEQLRVMMVEKSAESKARLAAESVREEYERKLAEQGTAADTKDVFKAYLANAADALTRLLTYLESIRDDKNLPLYVSKVDGIVEMTQTRRNAL